MKKTPEEQWKEWLDKTWNEIEKRDKEVIQPFLEKAKKSIKHPHFTYAVADTEKLTITFKRKKWYQWFSGKRVVCIKIIPMKVDTTFGYDRTGD